MPQTAAKVARIHMGHQVVRHQETILRTIRKKPAKQAAKAVNIRMPVDIVTMNSFPIQT